MADRRLGVALVAAGLTLSACARPHQGERERFVPAPKGSAAPTQRERRESADPPKRDPSLKPPAGYKRMAIGGVAPTRQGFALVLLDETGKRGVLLDVGGGGVRKVSLGGADRRPTRQLLAAALRKMGGEVVGVRIERVEDEIFYGSALLAKGEHLFELDAPPAEALSLVVADSVPILVSDAVMARAGVDVERLDFRRLRNVGSVTRGREEFSL